MIQLLNTDRNAVQIDSAAIIYGINITNKAFKLVNYIINCALFVIYKCIIIRNFENKVFNHIKMQCLLQQETRNRIEIESKSKTFKKNNLA